MAYPTDRVILHDRAGNLLPELCPDEVFSRIRSEEINGVHEMVIVTTRRMEEGWRALTVDGTGTWREWVLTEPDEAHENGETALGTYRFVWSLQYDLTTSYSHTEAEAGMGSSCTSLVALQKALEGVNDWVPGTCDAPSIPAGKGCVMIYESAWSRLSKVVEATGGEVEAQITVSNLYGVTAREVNLRAHVGSTSATRRFDWGHDVANIHRVPDPGPYYCRIVPLGRGEQEYAEDDETTFEWPLDITEETGDPNLYYVQDDEAAEVFKVPDGQGGWLYPTKAVSYSEDDPELLLNAAMEDLHNHTRPGVTYEANVFQFAEAGMDVKGVALGDDIHIVDRGFNPDAALRIQGRIVKIEVDELSPETTTVLTIGSVRDGITSITGALSNLVGDLSSRQREIDRKQRELLERMANLDTATYLRGLLKRINAEISATGGYAYLVPGEGIITYDAEVSDPLVGIEATQVVQIKGGSIRIANSRKSSFSGINDWDWKTVFTSGHILADLVTSAKLTSGYIGNAQNGDYWDLDSSRLYIGGTASVGGRTVNKLLQDVDSSATAAADAAKVATNYLSFSTSNGLDVGYSGTNAKTRINGSGVEIFDNSGSSALFAGVQNSKSIVRVGRASGSGNIVMSSDGYVDMRNANTVMAHFGYGKCKDIYNNTTSMYPYYVLGEENTDTTKLRGQHSLSGGFHSIAGPYGIAYGWMCDTTGTSYGYAFGDYATVKNGILAVGDGVTANGAYAVAIGCGAEATGQHSVAFGYYTRATGAGQTVIGECNATSSTHLFIIGMGQYSGEYSKYKNAFYVTNTGSAWLNGTLTQNSDKRLKEHHAYLGDDACEFIRKLKPALYSKDGERHVGFYAQDVADAEPETWDTVTVTAQHTDESLDFDPLTLDYTAIIAPLVAYTQQLEKRIEQLEKRLESMDR